MTEESNGRATVAMVYQVIGDFRKEVDDGFGRIEGALNDVKENQNLLSERVTSLETVNRVEASESASGFSRANSIALWAGVIVSMALGVLSLVHWH